VCTFLATATVALAKDHGSGQFKGVLSGYNEIPAVLTTGSGQVTLAVSNDQKTLNVTLKFSNLVGVAQTASFYLGLPGTTGGVVAPICGGTKPACPTAATGTVTVALAVADIQAIAAQGLTAADLATALKALANGAIYVNVITDKFASGEIRGQVGRGFGGGNGQGDDQQGDN
jgi:hypothetical protein